MKRSSSPEKTSGLKEKKTDKFLQPAKKVALKKTQENNAISTSPIKAAKNSKIITVEKHDLTLTNVNKIYFDELKITKGDVINYYNNIYKYIIPYLKGRPQSLKRNPNGIKDAGFFHKDMSAEMPEWADTVKLFSESTNKDINYLICNNNATLLYMANLGCIEINPWNSRIKSIDRPDYIIIDIDPSDKNTFDDVIETAKAVKEVLDKAKATGYIKTSGASGMHIYIPLGAKYDYDHARSFAELIAHFTVEKLPNLTTTERSLSKRAKNKLYVDFLQNRKGQTLASAYSLRPKPGATVSAPIEWSKLKKGLHPSKFDIKSIFKRIDKKGDIFGNVLGKGVDMKKCLKNLEGV